MIMVTLRLSFYECEHNEDMQNYISDMVSCGAKIINSELDTDEVFDQVFWHNVVWTEHWHL
jgi:hypothetical protein